MLAFGGMVDERSDGGGPGGSCLDRFNTPQTAVAAV